MADHVAMPKLVDLTVEFISLVKRPANGRRIILRGTAAAREFPITKADARLHRVYGIVYAPDAVDAQGDWTDAETIRRAADAWMREGRALNVDREHDFDPQPAFVAESWLIRPGDPLFPEEKDGAWAVGIQIEDAALWAAIEAGEVEGLSLAGTARLEKTLTPGPSPQGGGEKGFFKRLFTRKEQDMTPDEVRAIVKEALDETLAKAQAEASREKVEKASETALAEAKRLTEALDAVGTEVADLKKRIEALEKTPAAPAAPAEGEKAPAAESFV